MLGSLLRLCALLAGLSVKTLAALLLVVITFALAVVWVLLRILWFLAPYLVRAACVLLAVWSLDQLALTAFDAFTFEPHWLAGIAAMQAVGIVIVVALLSLDAVRAAKHSFWAICLFTGLTAWAAVVVIHGTPARALPIFPVALAIVTNPLILSGGNKMNDYKTIGEMMDENAHSGWSQLAKWGGYLIYLGGIVYVVAHNVNLFSATLPPALQVWAYVTVGILALNAIALPLGIHFQFAPGGQREWATVIYALDLLVAAANAVVDSIVNRGGTPQGLEGFYYQYVVVGAPIFFGLIAWAVIWLLDPSQKMRDAIAHTRASTAKVLITRIAQEAKADVESNEAVTQAARQLGRDAARAVTGQALPLISRNGKTPAEALPSGNGQGSSTTTKTAEVESVPFDSGKRGG